MSVKSNSSQKLAVFIHSTNIPPHKNQLILQICKMMNINNFLDTVDFVFINNIGEPLNEHEFKSLHPSFVVENYSKQLDLFENCTIRQLHAFCKIHPDYKVLYMHTKGVTYSTSHPFYPGIQSWIRFFMYCLIENVDTCIQYLDMYDTVGTNYQRDDENPHHYSGNFWWANAYYLNTLDVSYMKDKYDAEFWILRNPKALWYNMYKLEHMYQVDYPRENYDDKIQKRIHENILYCKFGTSGIGLCNQLYSLVNTMVLGSIHKGHTLIVVDDFMGDLNSNQYHDAASILDFTKINHAIKSYGLTLISKRAIQVESIKVEYGQTHVTLVDITNQMMERFYTKNHLCIPKGTSLNNILGYDPCPNVRKQIYFTYTINGFTFHDTRDEVRLFLHEDMEIDFKNWKKKPWISPTNILDSKHHTNKFNHFLQNMYFNAIYEKYANLFIQSSLSRYKDHRNINVIHLRLEDDAIPFWSSINGISCEAYRQALVKQYIHSIKAHIEPTNSINILLSMNTDNEVTKWMKEQNYIYVQMDKTMVQGREVNAIIDLLISAKCNNVFIGNINPHNYHGSTFSYTILNALRNKSNVKKICIDSDDIYHPAYVV